MSLESGNFIKDLIASNPPGGDPASQGDDHIRLIKNVLKQQFPGFTLGKPITLSEDQLNSAMNPGAYGLGGFAMTVAEATINTANLATGFYYVFNDGSALLPVPNPGYLINIDNEVSGFAMRYFVQYDGGTLWSQTKVSGTWGAWFQHWNQINTPKQANAFDLTAGAMLAPTSFGVGQSLYDSANANLNAAPYVGGGFNGRWLRSVWTNAPTGENNSIALVELRSYDVNHGMQRFYSIQTKKEYVRYITPGPTFSPWAPVGYATEQIEGNPGFQVINRICTQWGQTAPVADDSSVVITLPKAMSQAYAAQVTPIAGPAGTTFVVGGVTNLNGSQLTIANMSNTGTAYAFFWTVWGLV